MRRHLNETSSYTAPLDLHFSFIFKDTKKNLHNFIFFVVVVLKKITKTGKKSDDDDEENDAITNKRTKKGKKKEVLLSLVFKTLAMISFLSVMHMRDNDIGATILTREPVIIIIDQLWRGVVNIS